MSNVASDLISLVFMSVTVCFRSNSPVAIRVYESGRRMKKSLAADFSLLIIFAVNTMCLMTFGICLSSLVRAVKSACCVHR
jgi:hypothetical protein